MCGESKQRLCEEGRPSKCCRRYVTLSIIRNIMSKRVYDQPFGCFGQNKFCKNSKYATLSKIKDAKIAIMQLCKVVKMQSSVEASRKFPLKAEATQSLDPRLEIVDVAR